MIDSAHSASYVVRIGLFGVRQDSRFQMVARFQILSVSSAREKEVTVAHSVLDAIRAGIWDFEPTDLQQELFEATQAMPGSSEKLAVLTRRVAQGLPLWHPADRRICDDSTAE
jgi:hypothetical protein